MSPLTTTTTVTTTTTTTTTTATTTTTTATTTITTTTTSTTDNNVHTHEKGSSAHDFYIIRNEQVDMHVQKLNSNILWLFKEADGRVDLFVMWINQNSGARARLSLCIDHNRINRH
eukprot:3773410-Pyramimonas_sp.AAC.1